MLKRKEIIKWEIEKRVRVEKNLKGRTIDQSDLIS